MTHPRPWVLTSAALFLFLIWSNSFIAVSFLLGGEGTAARLDWVSLSQARFLPASSLCAAYLLLFRRKEAVAVFRGHWRRLLVCGFFAVPGYHFALAYGQQHGVPAPIASLTTTVVPLFVMALAALFLHERLTRRRLAGFAIAATGMTIIATAKLDDAGLGYPLLIAITALAPGSWSCYSVISKPMAGRVSPIVWTYLATTLGGVLQLPALPGPAWNRLVELDGIGWSAVLYLSVPCTVMGYALWTWLLRHLPATTVGFTVFLNPPLTTASKWVLASLFPATFLFTIQLGEWIGGAITLTGMAIAVYTSPRLSRIRRG